MNEFTPIGWFVGLFNAFDDIHPLALMLGLSAHCINLVMYSSTTSTLYSTQNILNFFATATAGDGDFSFSLKYFLSNTTSEWVSKYGSG